MWYLVIGLFIATAIAALVYAMKKEKLTEENMTPFLLGSFILAAIFCFIKV